MKKCLFCTCFHNLRCTPPLLSSSSSSLIVLTVEVKTGRMALLPRQRNKQEKNQSVWIRIAVKIELKIYNQMNYTLWHEHTWFQVASRNGFV